MKKFDAMKTRQLVFLILFAVVGVLIIFTDAQLYYRIANDPHIRTLCFMLWLILVVSFLFIFIDFSLFTTYKKDYTELDYAVSSDPVAGIANRYSCDAVIQKYLDRPLPDDIGCIMFDLTNLGEVNQNLGHVKGNQLIYDFSNILQSSSARMCFVGRNGGSTFLALFESCNSQKMKTYLNRVYKKTQNYNKDPKVVPVQYQYGIAYREKEEAVKTITDLIALSSRRIYNDEFDYEQ